MRKDAGAKCTYRVWRCKCSRDECFRREHVTGVLLRLPCCLEESFLCNVTHRSRPINPICLFISLFRDGRAKILKGILRAFGKGMTPKDLEKPPRRPGGRGAANAAWIRIGPFWLEGGSLESVDTAELDDTTKQRRCGWRDLRRSIGKHAIILVGDWPYLRPQSRSFLP